MQAKVRGWAAAGLLAAGLGVAGTAQAVALIDLGGGIIRDPSTNLEWLANANLAATNTLACRGLESIPWNCSWNRSWN